MATSSTRAARVRTLHDARAPRSDNVVYASRARPRRRAQGDPFPFTVRHGDDAMYSNGDDNILLARPGADLSRSAGAGASRLAVAPRHPPDNSPRRAPCSGVVCGPGPRRRRSRRRRDLATDVVARPEAPIESSPRRPARIPRDRPPRRGRTRGPAHRREVAATTTSRWPARAATCGRAAASRDAGAWHTPSRRRGASTRTSARTWATTRSSLRPPPPARPASAPAATRCRSTARRARRSHRRPCRPPTRPPSPRPRIRRPSRRPSRRSGLYCRRPRRPRRPSA